MICKKCGAKFSDGMFCPECGARTMPVSSSGDGQMNTWEAAFEYSDGEEYNTKMYGPQGQLEEQQIKKIDINVGDNKIFENKKIVLTAALETNNNAKLEFRNCEFPWLHIMSQRKVRMNFDYCVIKKVSGEIVGCNSIFFAENVLEDDKDKGAVLQFRNCAFIGDNKNINRVYDEYSINTWGSVYFENCYIKLRSICRLRDNLSQELKFRNCIIINDFANQRESLIKIDMQQSVELENCFIRSSHRLIEGNYNLLNLSIKNCYFDDYTWHH